MKRIVLPLLLISNLCMGQVNLNLGLKAYYPFSGNANDASGNNNNPVFNNATLTADRFGNANSAFHFNGTSSYIQIPNSPSLNMGTTLSLCAWVKPQGFYAGPCHGNSILGKGNTGTTPGLYLLWYDDNAGTNGVNCSGGPVNTAVENFYGAGCMTASPGYTPYIQTNQWYNVIVTYDGTTARLYVNCQLKNSVSQAGLTFTNADDLFIGKLFSAAFPYWVNGDIDEVRIYDRALTVDEVNVLGGCNAGLTCSNWLRTQAVGQSVTVGDLDVSGNQITVEANFNCSSFPISRPDKFEDIVSKHSTTTDINYDLRMDMAGITTTNGQFLTPVPCDNLALNKTFHVAMVYDGTTLKFYRNGFLMSQVAATGNLVLNNWLTTIGDYAVNNPVGTNFMGYINEVRIWNVARTQAQLRTYMNASLPGPTTQPGLLAYYTFDNLLNKQGNPLWNGTLNGVAAINTTNPNCNFTADSCAFVTPISNIINTYTPVLALNPCDNKITVEDGSTFNTGDTVLMIQMKGAVIDSSNTAAFGTITNYNNAGNYEFNYVKSKAGNIIELQNKLLRSYDIPVGKVQLVRVPYYSSSVSVTSTLTCLPWDGNKGGILVLNVKDTVNLNADINVTGKGFLKGKMHNSNINAFTCDVNNYYYPDNGIDAAGKGEGISFLSSARNSGKGPAANGGGGGLNTNSGGGGGANGNVGGRGGYEWNAGCPNYLTTPNWGYPGNNLLYSNASNKIFMGGGGGAGHCNNQFDDPSVNADYNGGNGGGLVIINSEYVKNNNYKIISKGDSAYQPAFSATYVTHDGMGAGGAGGTVLLNSNNYINNLLIDVSGGKGANMVSTLPPGFVGPGGGGGGGVVWVKQNVLPASVVVTNAGGLNGVITLAGNNPYGAAPGLAGINMFSLSVPFTTVPFQKNIDSVRIKDSLLNCNGFDFKGLGYTNTNPVSTWQWYFGDGGTANTQNTSHAYLLAGTYTVKLVITDINGCRDSITKDVVALPGIVADAGNDTAFCSNIPVTLQLHGSGGGTYSWTPAIYLNNPTLQNPIATISSTTIFYLTVTGVSLCNSVDSVIITVNPVPLTQTLPDTPICRGSLLVLTTVPNSGTYSWTPAASVSNPNIASPQFTDIVSQMMIVTNTNGFGCSAKDTVNVTVKPLPIVKTIEDTTICSVNPLTLVTSGAQTYSWTPVIFLSNPAIASPVYSGNLTQTYYVTGTGLNGCKAKDTVTVTVHVPGLFQAPPDKFMCNNTSVELDGFNGTAVDYLWSPGAYLSNTGIINPIANPPSSRAYNVFIRDRACNTDSNFTVQVIVTPGPVTNAGKLNDIDCVNHSAQLFASGGTQYLWSPATGLNNTTIANPVATITGTQKYYVIVTDASGCTGKDSVTVQVNTAASLSRYMPNAFTPNGDTKNDCYGLPRWFYIRNLQFIIYNRWGEKVFATSDPHACWDGNYRGTKADPGTYVYYIKAHTDCGDEEQKGTFLLIR